MEFTLPGVPLEFTWAVPPVECGLTDGVLRAIAAPGTDIFIDPADRFRQLSAARALAAIPDGDWQFSARVRVEFRDRFDAGVLLLWSDDRHWAKLCFERSPAGQPMVVSVVCRKVADDANSWPVSHDTVWLRVSRVDGAYAFHASDDGQRWQFVRHFTIPAAQMGFVVQAPIGAGCTAVFDCVRFVPATLSDLRDGS